MAEGDAQENTQEKKMGKGKKLGLGCGGFIVLLLLLAVIGAALGGEDATVEEAAAPADSGSEAVVEEPTEEPAAEAPDPSSAISTWVDLTLKASRSGDSIKFSGTTNLPEGTVLFWEAMELDGIWCDDGQVEVKDGKYSGLVKDMLCDWGEGDPYVPAGDVELWVAFIINEPVASLEDSVMPHQPAELVAVMGEEGENMEGDCLDIQADGSKRAERITVVKP